jgi:hypothetical protein
MYDQLQKDYPGLALDFCPQEVMMIEGKAHGKPHFAFPGCLD